MKSKQNSTKGIEELKKKVEKLEKELFSANEKLVEFIKTKQKSQESSRNSEAQIKSIFSAAPMGIGVIINRTFQVVNERFIQIVGYSSDEIIGKNSRFLYVSEEEYVRVGNEKYNQISKFGIGSVESQFKCKDGKIIDIYLSSAPIEYNDLSKGISFTALDISERKRTEKALKENETKYRLIAENTFDWEYWIDGENNYVYHSPACEKVTGFNPSDFKSNPKLLFDLVTNKYKQNVIRHYKNEVKNKPDEECLEFSIINKNGEERWIEHNCVPVYDDEGNFAGRRGVNRDITNDKLIEKKLVESESKFRSLFENHTAIEMLLDAKNGNIVDANHSAAVYYEYSIEKLKSMNISQINILSKKQIKTTLEKVKAGQENYFQHKHRLSNGNIRDVEIYSSPIEIKNKKFLHSIIHDITDKKIVQRELQKLSLAIEHNPVIVIITDIEGNIEYVNPKFTEVTGYNFEEVKGKNPRLLNSGNHSKEHFEKLWDTILDGKTWSGEFKNKTKNGKLYWESASISPIRNEYDEITHFVAVKEDISLKREHEKRIRKNEYILNETQTMSKVGGWEYKLSNERMIWTNEVFKIHAITNGIPTTPEEGMQYYHENDRPKIIEAFKRCVEEGIEYDLELRFINENNQDLWVRTSGKPIYVDGEIYKVVGNFADITSRKIGEIELLKLSRATEQSPTSILITDLNGNIEYVNPKFTEVTGYSFNEVFAKNPRILKSGKQHEVYYKKMWDIIQSGNVWNGEFLNKKKNGELFWESAIISPIKDKDGIVTHFVAVKEDITEKKKLLNEIIEAKEKAENADKMKSNFLAQMSHEIRTPINSMVSAASLLRYDLEENLDEDQTKSFDIVDSAGARIIRTVDLLINLSEIQAGTYEPSLSNVDILNDILRLIVADNKNVAMKKNIDLYIKSTTDDTEIVADSYTVNQIFLQLIDNAIKYTEKGEVSINLRKNKDKQLVVEIKDTGVGIANEYVSKMFEPFSQEEMGYTRKFEGNGIGLALVKTYAELNNIKIEVESEKGTGSKFRVVFK